MTTQQVIIAILVIGAVIVAVVMLRKRQPSVTVPPDVNAEMPLLAQDAVKWAAEKKVTLDYTPESVERVEGLLAELHEKRAAGHLPDDQVTRAAVRYGAYVGEVLRRMHNGSWAIDHEVVGPGTFPIRWGEHESFPIGWCGKRIINGEEDNVWVKFRVLLLDDAKDAMTFSPDGGEGAEK
jgi:hypothetical protein